MGESDDRLFRLLERVEDKVDRIEDKVDGHTVMIARLEENQHSPEMCPVNTTVNEHLQDHRRDAWKGMAKEGMRLLAAIGAAVGVSAAKG